MLYTFSRKDITKSCAIVDLQIFVVKTLFNKAWYEESGARFLRAHYAPE